ncbi:hypothetical protein IWQ51_004137 [Labrenzia sp. EL_142]|nr:hypothetical protein [Labrenzia sp. EL_142]
MSAQIEYSFDYGLYGCSDTIAHCLSSHKNFVILRLLALKLNYVGAKCYTEVDLRSFLSK